jgi:uncharacterized YigZ family protein
MIEYITIQSYAEEEFVEKRSRFIGRVWPIHSEEEARQHIQETAKEFHDARHTCWCYQLHETAVERYSDDGEPQGTAGQPMLEYFRNKGIENYCCTVTRYFGGILLGTGGLVRAYTGAADLAAAKAGISLYQTCREFLVECTYSLFERLRGTVETFSGRVVSSEYSSSVLMSILIPEESAGEFERKVTDLSSGNAVCMPGKLRTVEMPHLENN